MKKKILIIGKNSFISFNLKDDLKKTFLINTISFEDFLKKKKIIYQNIVTLLIVP